jgi:hypothetical protein
MQDATATTALRGPGAGFTTPGPGPPPQRATSRPFEVNTHPGRAETVQQTEPPATPRGVRAVRARHVYARRAAVLVHQREGGGQNPSQPRPPPWRPVPSWYPFPSNRSVTPARPQRRRPCLGDHGRAGGTVPGLGRIWISQLGPLVENTRRGGVDLVRPVPVDSGLDRRFRHVAQGLSVHMSDYLSAESAGRRCRDAHGTACSQD